jgi:hypothetical protein
MTPEQFRYLTNKTGAAPSKAIADLALGANMRAHVGTGLMSRPTSARPPARDPFFGTRGVQAGIHLTSLVKSARLLLPPEWNPSVRVVKITAPPGAAAYAVGFQLDEHSCVQILRPDRRGEVVVDARLMRAWEPTIFTVITDPIPDDDDDPRCINLAKDIRRENLLKVLTGRLDKMASPAHYSMELLR